MVLPQGFFVGIDVLGAVLLHFLWQGAALGMLYWLLRPLCTSVTARYRFGLGVLLAQALAPVLTAIYLWPTAGADAVNTSGISTAIGAVAGPALSSWHLQQMLPWLVAAWLCGVLTIASHSLWQWRKLMHLVRTASRPSTLWEARLAQLCARFDLRRPVRLLCSTAAVTPMLIGWIKPVILLPASMLSGFTPQQIELIIAHELGHVRRFDYLFNVVQVAIETVLFYHPVVHWISHDVRNAREACCDDLVVQHAGANRLAYAHALADLEEMRLHAPALGASGGVLLARIKRIVGESEALEPLPRSYALPILLVCAAVASLLWRSPHSLPELAANLQDIPRQTLAMLSGNPQLAWRQSLSITLPRPDIRPLSMSPEAIRVPAPVVDSKTDAVKIKPPVVAPSAIPVPSMVPSAAAMPAAQPLAEAEVNAPEPSVAAPAAKAAPVHVVPPVYPQRAMSTGIEGSVELEYQVEASGAVSHIRVVSAHPAGVFDAAATAALSEWRFPESGSNETRTQNFAFTLHGKTATADKCQVLTGTMICRRPGE